MTIAASTVDSIYTVAIGDSLSKIAMRFYGDPQKYSIIADRNSINPQAILMIGQRLIIPAYDPVQEVQITAQRLPEVVAPTGGLQPAPSGIETVTTTASVWWKDWRYWAAIAAVGGIGWYLLSGSKRRG